MIDRTDPAQNRAFLLHYARVNLTEARRRRHQRGFSATLLEWAAKARREAAAIVLAPVQGEFFS